MTEAPGNLPYNPRVIEHFEQPRNVWADPQDLASAGSGSWSDDARAHRVTGEGGRVDSGVWITFQCEVLQRVVRRARFRAYGCPHTIALASWLTERLVGETLVDRYTLDRQEIERTLGLPTEKLRSVLAAEDAVRACAKQLDAKETR